MPIVLAIVFAAIAIVAALWTTRERPDNGVAAPGGLAPPSSRGAPPANPGRKTLAAPRETIDRAIRRSADGKRVSLSSADVDALMYLDAHPEDAAAKKRWLAIKAAQDKLSADPKASRGVLGGVLDKFSLIGGGES